METTGRVKTINQDWKTEKIVLSLELDHADSNALNEISGLECLDISVKKHRIKRSLNANAYFHKLVSLIAHKINGNNIAVKNRLIREYGQYEYIDGMIPTYMMKAEYEDKILNREGVHFQTVGYEHLAGQDYVKLAVMRGSHTYNTAEMSRLIDGTVQEAKELGIETLPPDQLERMKSLWTGISEKNA